MGNERVFSYTACSDPGSIQWVVIGFVPDRSWTTGNEVWGWVTYHVPGDSATKTSSRRWCSVCIPDTCKGLLYAEGPGAQHGIGLVSQQLYQSDCSFVRDVCQTWQAYSSTERTPLVYIRRMTWSATPACLSNTKPVEALGGLVKEVHSTWGP